MMGTDRLVRDYQKETNLSLALICRINVLLLFIVGVLNYLHVFKIADDIYPALLISAAILMLPTLFYNVFKWNYLIVRYFVLTLLVFMAGLQYSLLSYHVIIMLAFPLITALLYCDKKSILYTAILSIPVMIVSHLLAFQIKLVPDEPLVTLKGVWLYGILPRVLEFTSFAIICYSMAGKVQKLISSLVKANHEVYEEQEILIKSLAEMVEAQSSTTGQHIKRVAEYTWILCHRYGFSEEECWKISNASMMHDVGKIMIPQEIINKPGKLTAEEFEVIKTHTEFGKELLKNSKGDLLKLSAEIAYEHHERYDGKGYHGIKGEDINIAARCVAIADVFDALVSRRPYKEAWAPEDAKAEIVRGKGTQFDPKLVDLFEKNYEDFLEVVKKYPDY